MFSLFFKGNVKFYSRGLTGNFTKQFAYANFPFTPPVIPLIHSTESDEPLILCLNADQLCGYRFFWQESSSLTSLCTQFMQISESWDFVCPADSQACCRATDGPASRTTLTHGILHVCVRVCCVCEYMCHIMKLLQPTGVNYLAGVTKSSISHVVRQTLLSHM